MSSSVNVLVQLGRTVTDESYDYGRENSSHQSEGLWRTLFCLQNTQTSGVSRLQFLLHDSGSPKVVITASPAWWNRLIHILSMSRLLLICTMWVGEFRSSSGRTDSLSFCFSAFQSPSSALNIFISPKLVVQYITRYFCTTVFCRPTTRISVCFNFLH